MKPLILVSVVTQLVLLLAPGKVAHAQEFVCNNGTEIRTVRLEYPGRDNLCEVSVTQADESREVKWLANSTSVFCSNKIIELAGKYTNQWNYACEEVASRTRLDGLAPAARDYLDALVSQIVEQGQSMTPAFKLVGVNAVGNYSETRPDSTMVAQLSIIAVEENLSTDRIYVVDFDSEGPSVKAIHIGLAGLLASEKSPVLSAVVTEVDAAGAFTVATTLASDPESAASAAKECNGLIVLQVDNGELDVEQKQQVVCQ